jgi:sugar-specific transcriptional regulator TrmB
METIEILKNVGLTSNEASVYMSLLKTGSSLASNIAKKCNLHRTHVYDCIEKLIKKGLVSFVIRENRKYFQATDPERLLEFLEQKKEDVRGILPELKQIKEERAEEVEAEIFKGKEGWKTVMEDMIKCKGKEILMLGGSGKGFKVAPYFMPNLNLRIKKAKIKFRSIYRDTGDARKAAEGEKKLNREPRILPKDMKNVMQIFVYGETVAMIPMTPDVEKEPVTFVIKNKETAQGFKEYFEWMWKLSKKF